MRIDSNLKEPLETAITAAAIRTAWPEFVRAFMDGDDQPRAVATFNIAIGHYLSLNPAAVTLVVEVFLCGTRVDYIAPVTPPSSRLVPKLVQSALADLDSMDIGRAPVQLSEVHELVSHSAELSFSVKARVGVCVIES